MWIDPVVAETRALRDEYASQFNFDMDAIFEDLLKRQATHPERIVTFPPRRPAPTTLGRNNMNDTEDLGKVKTHRA